jgi:hypothetical protein
MRWRGQTCLWYQLAKKLVSRTGLDVGGANCSSASHDIPHVLWNQKVYRTHNSPVLDPITSTENASPNSSIVASHNNRTDRVENADSPLLFMVII